MAYYFYTRYKSEKEKASHVLKDFREFTTEVEEGLFTPTTRPDYYGGDEYREVPGTEVERYGYSPYYIEGYTIGYDPEKGYEVKHADVDWGMFRSFTVLPNFRLVACKKAQDVDSCSVSDRNDLEVRRGAGIVVGVAAQAEGWFYAEVDFEKVLNALGIDPDMVNSVTITQIRGIFKGDAWGLVHSHGAMMWAGRAPPTLDIEEFKNTKPLIGSAIAPHVASPVVEQFVAVPTWSYPPRSKLALLVWLACSTGWGPAYTRLEDISVDITVM